MLQHHDQEGQVVGVVAAVVVVAWGVEEEVLFAA